MDLDASGFEPGWSARAEGVERAAAGATDAPEQAAKKAAFIRKNWYASWK